MAMHIREGAIHLLDLRTRMPFKYGIATMTSTPHAFVRLRVEVGSKLAVGIAADHLPPKWFTKDPARPVEEEIHEMLRVIEHALRVGVGLRGETPFDVWQQLHTAQDRWGRQESLPPLLTQFGTSLVERALIEAFCRALGRPLPDVLHANALGIRLQEIHPSLEGLQPADLLPESPLTPLIARHTVGLADPLEDADILPAERLADGLPQSLTDCIRTYGLLHFKIKVRGDLAFDRDRLRRIAQLIQTHARPDCRFSLDGNEQFHSFAEFRTFFETLCHDAALETFLTRLLFVEQPLHRDVALQADVKDILDSWPDRPDLIIDESDGELDSLPRALQLGYHGTSHKNCKGIFKGIANACLLAHLRRREPNRRCLMSGEDLANIGPVALLQDLAVCAVLGIASVERNGHHYFAGLSMFPLDVQQQILAAHGDLYHASAGGWPTLTIERGTLTVRSLLQAPFGVGPIVNVEPFPSLEAWRQAHGG